MAKLRLQYFDIKAVGEPIRFMFAYAGAEYEDDRIQMKDWAELKKKLGNGQVPILYVDGVQLTQSFAIMHYLASLYDLQPSDPFLAARCLEIASSMEELRLARFRDLALLLIVNPDDKVKIEGIRAELRDNYFRKYFKIFNDFIGLTSGPYITGEKLSWADLMMASWTDVWETHAVGPKYLDDYPNMKRLKQTVFALPAINTYVQSRPKTAV